MMELDRKQIINNIEYIIKCKFNQLYFNIETIILNEINNDMNNIKDTCTSTL